MKIHNFLAIMLTSVIFLLIGFSPTTKAGAIEGIRLCEETIIPALLPIMILSNLIINSKCSIFFEKTLGWLAEKLFRLPKCTAPAILFGLIGGYPAGAILTSKLLSQGMIDEKTAKRIMRINFSGGLAFIVTAVGTMKLESAKLGFILYFSSIIPSIIIGIINSFKIKNSPYSSKCFYSSNSFNDALIISVEDATKSILTMSAYIILFSAICSAIPIPSFAFPLLEITNGIFSNKMSIEYLAFFLSFGGICVHLQLLNYLPSYFDFLIFRIINAVCSFLIVKLYTIIFPVEQTVFSNQSSITPKLTEANAGFGIIMIFGCAVIIFDIENRRLKLR